MKPFETYVYATDHDSFYNVKRKKAVSEAYLIGQLQLFNPAYKDLKRALECVEMMKKSGVPFKDIGAKKADVESLYAEAAPTLPFLWKTNQDGSSAVYYVSDEGEATPILGTDVDNLRSSLAAAPDAFDSVVELYNNSEILNSGNSKPTLQAYMNSILERLLLDSSKRLDVEPALLSWDKDELAFKKFDPSKLQDSGCKTWDEFLNRLDYPDIFKAWVWSVFEPENDGRQLMWLRGSGNDGKSRVISALMHIYGRRYTAALVHGDVDSQFFFSKIYGKRFTVYDDCKQPRLISYEKVHIILGKGEAAIEHKFGQPFTGGVYSKILVGSNYYPEIDFFKNNERTRLICLSVKRYKDGNAADPKFTDKLISEQYGFLYKCKQAYDVLCENGVSISVPRELSEKMKDKCSSESSKLIEDFMEDTLTFDPKRFFKRVDLQTALTNYIAESGSKWKIEYAMNDLKRILEDRGVEDKRIEVGNRRVYVWTGIGKRGDKECVLE